MMKSSLYRRFVEASSLLPLACSYFCKVLFISIFASYSYTLALLELSERFRLCCSCLGCLEFGLDS